ncbi:MAG: CHAD domain-containing protein [Betaproteobacteria bacterium]|nr:MAG: CHAD domain-containing protein [Betaproteobacteria bacterium]
MALETRYAARRDWPVERLVESLAALLTVRRRPITRQRVTFLDTFDGRIGRVGACLTLTADAGGNRIQWRQGNLRVGCTLGGMVQFAWDLPQGSVRQRIEPIIEMRRLLPLAEAEQDGVLLEVMDETRKIIARLDIVAGRARAPKRRSPWQPFQPFLTLNALRGYDEQCAGPIAIIESRPGIERSDLALQGHVLRAIGASLPQDVSVYRVELEPMVRADIGSLRMQRELLRIITANHAGVLTGLDSEFLRDFRVGVRRSRALLGQIKDVLPQAEIDHFKTELSWLGRITGPARELDVLLLGLRSPSTKLNEDQQRVILARLEQERARAQQALTEQLTSERYRQLVNGWKEFLSQDVRVKPGDGCGALPLVTIVSRRGWRLYRRTLSGIEHVSNDTPAHALHQIRTDAKKLRYLIDAAASLYDPGDLAIVLRALRRLQSVLGEFNDACMQASWLRQYAGVLDETERDVTSVRQAAEALADLADRRTEELRKPANQQLLRFGESATRVAFERIFHIKHLPELVQ